MTEPQVPNASAEEILRAALELFSKQGYGATTMRQIAEKARTSLGNVYHHFKNKEQIFSTLLDRYFQLLLDPQLPLNRVFAQAKFPDDLEELAAAIEEVVDRHGREIMLIYIDVIEFGGKHVHWFYETMAERFHRLYQQPLHERQERGELGNVNPVFAVMLAVRWLFYFFTVEKYFGVPMHLGMDPQQAVQEFIHLLRCGLLPRGEPCPPTLKGSQQHQSSGRREGS
ncbi:MAG: TetR/AcrR family transcriptional regulator [Thermoanaerobaculum sp.]|nr:TetR/AcrR family transcriptional regulator [Thermoanaerobaculum sp.]MDW7967469.1 TetR/AcrR family transcriptional regulator [Thermoanaerobaculum sp.]